MCKKINEKLDGIENNLEELYSIFNSINWSVLPLILFSLEKGAFVIRQRINPEGKELSLVSEMSYPPHTCCKEYGRANIPFHPMFYCCSFNGNFDSTLPRIVSLLETSSFVKNKDTVGVERSTCSKWKVIEKLELLALPFSEKYSNPNLYIKQIQEEWNDVKQQKNIDSQALELVEYMSDEIAKEITENEKYFKIANFVYFLLYMNNMTCKYDGVVYPSVAAEGDGLNIVLKPECVDKKLKFDCASLCYLNKNREEANVIVVNHSTSKKEDGVLLFEKRSDFNEEDFKNVHFVN
ncbi:MAG: hypothetical protein IKQ72_10935 [Bacteroidaceae bacterium]|nr:hypothetical protein [Bacteroidaceae bacterium]